MNLKPKDYEKNHGGHPRDGGDRKGVRAAKRYRFSRKVGHDCPEEDHGTARGGHHREEARLYDRWGKDDVQCIGRPCGSVGYGGGRAAERAGRGGRCGGQHHPARSLIGTDMA